MKQQIRKYWWIALIVLFCFSLFYWFQLRPSFIKGGCATKAIEALREQNNKGSLSMDEGKKIYDMFYTICIHKEGL